MISTEKHRLFKGYYQKLSFKQKQLFEERLKLFCQAPRHPLLKVHRLTGNLSGLYAFWVGGDLRVVFDWVTKDHIVLHRVGTHNQVY